MQNSYEIKPGKIEDVKAVVPLIAEFTEEILNDYGMGMDPEVALKAFEHFVAGSFLLWYKGKPVGVFAGAEIKNHLTKERIFSEQIWFLSKPHRRAGIKLLKYAEDWCRAQGYTSLIMTHMQNSNASKIKAFYERSGYMPIETHYLKKI